MNYQSLKAVNSIRKIGCAAAFIFSVFLFADGAAAQYKGAPVKKERLVKALKSKQLQTADIVAVINSNGVDFKLTPALREALIAAGARPEVLRAIAENERSPYNISPKTGRSVVAYEDVLDQALLAYKEKKDAKGAIRILENAVKMKPKDAKAYQLLGFVHLYGLNNLLEAENYMRLAIARGGSAVFRVFHDDKGSFTQRCSGSLYISPERIRFESDDNIHTFETSTVNIDRVLLDEESSKIWKNHPIFKVFLKIGKSEARFRFAPMSANPAEPQIARRMIEESKSNRFMAKMVFK